MAINTATVVDRVTINVSFFPSEASESAIENTSNWSLTYNASATEAAFPPPAGDDFNDVGAAECMPFKVTALNKVLPLDNWSGAKIEFHPEFSPACVYTLKYKDSSKDITIPASLLPASGEGEFPKGPLEVITQAIGEQIHLIAGRPETYLLHDYTPSTETVVFSETTLGFPPRGEIWIGNTLFTYKSKFDGGFKDVALKEMWDKNRHPKSLYSRFTTPPFLTTIPVMTGIILHVPGVLPLDQEYA